MVYNHDVLSLISVLSIGLGVKKNQPIQFTRTSDNDIIWLYGSSTWMKGISYIFLRLFINRACTYNPNKPKFVFIDDSASQHQYSC